MATKHKRTICLLHFGCWGNIHTTNQIKNSVCCGVAAVRSNARGSTSESCLYCARDIRLFLRYFYQRDLCVPEQRAVVESLCLWCVWHFYWRKCANYLICPPGQNWYLFAWNNQPHICTRNIQQFQSILAKVKVQVKYQTRSRLALYILYVKYRRKKMYVFWLCANGVCGVYVRVSSQCVYNSMCSNFRHVIRIFKNNNSMWLLLYAYKNHM